MATPTREKIFQAQRDELLPTLPIFDWFDGDAHFRCWACGIASDGSWKLERAHIEARADGGRDDPENFLLLCVRCHRDQPDGAPREQQLEWVRARERWTTRAPRETAPLLARLEAEAGGPEDLARWYAAIGGLGFQELWRTGAAKAAGPSNATSNAELELASAARAWRETQLGPIAPDRPPTTPNAALMEILF